VRWVHSSAHVGTEPDLLLAQFPSEKRSPEQRNGDHRPLPQGKLPSAFLNPSGLPILGRLRRIYDLDNRQLRIKKGRPFAYHQSPHQRWARPNGYRHVFAISLPLVASMGTITLMQFTDRIFLANYSVEAITAALPAGILSFTLISFFMGVAGYTNSFVAQYTGARALDRVGAAL